MDERQPGRVRRSRGRSLSKAPADRCQRTPLERNCLVFLKLFERVYGPLTAGVLRPLVAAPRIAPQKLSQLDRLYQGVTCALDRLVSAVGLKAA